MGRNWATGYESGMQSPSLSFHLKKVHPSPRGSSSGRRRRTMRDSSEPPDGHDWRKRPHRRLSASSAPASPPLPLVLRRPRWNPLSAFYPSLSFSFMQRQHPELRSETLSWRNNILADLLEVLFYIFPDLKTANTLKGMSCNYQYQIRTVFASKFCYWTWYFCYCTCTS